ncbi:MAG: AAA family ATPase [Bacteroidia bacterium]
MKICKIWIKDWDQFKDIELDFTDPATGEPADKICFIGSNGTGKSKLLELLDTFLSHNFLQGIGLYHLVIFKIKFNNEHLYLLKYHEIATPLLFNSNFDEKQITEVYTQGIGFDRNVRLRNEFSRDETYSKLSELNSELYRLDINKSNIIFAPIESNENTYIKVGDVPEATLNEALSLFVHKKFYHKVSIDNVSEFWTQLIFLLKQREQKYLLDQELDTNKSKPIEVFRNEFDLNNKKPLEELSKVWNKILKKSNLEFDYQKAKIPVQLNDNLHAYIKLLNSDKVIPYNLLSTGIRNYIFRLGHIYSLYFNREIDSGFLLVDEPENSLFPDFLFDIIEIYQDVCKDKRGVNNTQMFFATHSPIVASQFEKHERIILDWQEDGTVVSYKGQSPRGDDPTDILANDFNSRTMDDYGTSMFEEYKKLKLQFVKEKDADKKMKLAGEISKLGTEYNFS